MSSDKSTANLCDLGHSKHWESSEEVAGETAGLRSRVSYGTVALTSPERLWCLHAEKHARLPPTQHKYRFEESCKEDVFALGLLLFSLLNGTDRRPHATRLVSQNLGQLAPDFVPTEPLDLLYILTGTHTQNPPQRHAFPFFSGDWCREGIFEEAPGAVLLVNRMLCLNPVLRPSMEDVVSDPWVSAIGCVHA